MAAHHNEMAKIMEEAMQASTVVPAVETIMNLAPDVYQKQNIVNSHTPKISVDQLLGDTNKDLEHQFSV